MTTPEIIDACAKTARKPFLIIGGHAVIAHGYSRSTVDLDLLVRQGDRKAWAEAVAALGYQTIHSHDAFEQFRSANQGLDLDLMFVNETTFEGLLAASQERSFGSISARVPSLPHLIALKLHVLKQGLAHRVLGDLDDVLQLLLLNGVDLNAPEWKQIFERYGNQELYEKIQRAIKAG